MSVQQHTQLKLKIIIEYHGWHVILCWQAATRMHRTLYHIFPGIRAI